MSSNDSKSNAPIVAFKGFDKNLQCRGYQFKVGETFHHDGEVKACSGGFHACEYPLNVFDYYPPDESRFAIVEMSGAVSRDGSDTKIAAASIAIRAELKIPDLVKQAVAWIGERVDKALAQTLVGNAATNTGYRSAATNTGYRSAATNTGDQSAATNTGDQSAATNTGYRSAATNTGDQSAATNTGYRSAASVEGTNSVAIATGYASKAKACAGSAIVLCYRDEDYNLVHIKAAIVGKKGVKADTWYSLNDCGKFVEAGE